MKRFLAAALLPLAVGAQDWATHDGAATDAAEDVIQDMTDRIGITDTTFFNDTVVHPEYENADTAIMTVGNWLYYYDRQRWNGLYEEWLRGMTNAPQTSKLGRPYVQGISPRVMEGIDNFSVGAVDRGNATNSVNVIASSARQFSFDVSNVTRAQRAFWNVYDNKGEFYPGVVNWMHRDTLFEAPWWSGLDPTPKKGAWIFTSARRTAHAPFYGDMGHDAATNPDVFSLYQTGNQGGPNHFAWAHDSSMGWPFLISNAELWTQRCLESLTGGAGDKPVNLCPSNLLWDGKARIDLDSNLHWGWEAARANGDIGGWVAGPDAMATKYKQLAWVLYLARISDVNVAPNARLAALASQIETVLEHAYCARANGDTVPVYGHSWVSGAMDEALLMYVWHRSAPSACDAAMGSVAPKTATLHAIDAKLADDAGDYVARDAASEAGLGLVAQDVEAMRTAWNTTRDTQDVSLDTVTAYGVLKSCSPHSMGGLKARWQIMVHEPKVRYRCLRQRENSLEETYQVKNESGFATPMRIGYRWGLEGRTVLYLSETTDGAIATPPYTQFTEIQATAGLVDETIIVPPGFDGYFTILVHVDATPARDISQLGNPAIDPDSQQSYNVTPLPNGKYQISVEVFNLGLDYADFQIHLLATDHVTNIGGEVGQMDYRNIRTLRLEPNTGPLPSKGLATWAVDDYRDVGMVKILSMYKDDAQPEVTDADNELVVRHYAPYP